jgi:hypothetical protein
MFKTEFNFTLPKGFVDRDGNLHKKGVMRLATAKDEIAPLQDHRVRSNQAYMIIILLSRVITKLGDLKSVDSRTVEQFFSVDLDYLQRLLCSLTSRKERVNFFIIFILSGAALIVAFYLDFFR